MLWKDVVKLISTTFSQNAIGDSTETNVEREVYANKLSVKRSEFYQAHAVGLKPEAVFEVKLIDYQGEKKLKYEGEEYNIIRSYIKDTENIELTCDRLVLEEDFNATALVVTTATLSPAFSGSTYAYTASVANAVSSVTVAVTCASASMLTINDGYIASGIASSAISLSVGANVIAIKAMKVGRPTKTYTITITRAAS